MPHRLSQTEFIAMIAMMFATIAFSIDAMLPALPQIAAELSPGDLNRAQLILTSFVLGMGVGTFFAGPLSDTFGRKPLVLVGSALYILSAAVAWRSQSLEVVLAARFLQGIGASGPRVVAVAIVRDLYAGRGMARIMSFVFMVFTLVPAIAPLLGAGIMSVGGWRSIFLAFIAFSVVSTLWIGLRQSETLPPAQRRPFRAAPLRAALLEILRHPAVRLSIMVQTLCYGILFTMISLVQPVYDVTFGMNDSFPFWFGGIAIVAGSASFFNARFVMRLGMRYLITWALTAQVILAAIMVVVSLMDLPLMLAFGIFVVWQTSVFAQAGLTIGNLNALAMEPMGHIAGMAASVIGAIATVGGAALAIPVGLMFDGTATPLALGICVEAALALMLMLHMRRSEQRAEKTAQKAPQKTVPPS